jgi:signal transduction histidine kinase
LPVGFWRDGAKIKPQTPKALLMRRLSLTLSQQLVVLLGAAILALQVMSVWIDRKDAEDRGQNNTLGNAPAVLAQTVQVLQAVPAALRPQLARAMSDPRNLFFQRAVPGLHPKDQRNPDFEAKAAAWIRAQGLPVAEIRIAERWFEEHPQQPPPGVSGLQSPLLAVGEAPPTVMMDHGLGIPPWVSGDWAALDRSGKIKPTASVETGPPRAPLSQRPPNLPPESERSMRVRVVTIALRLEGETMWTTLYRMRAPQRLNASISKLAFSFLGAAVLAGGVLLIGRRLMRPLNALAKSAEMLGRGERALVVAPGGARDIAEIISAFNRMNARVSQAVDYQIALLRSLGHDLKGPLASVGRLVANIDAATTREQIEARLARVHAIVETIISFSRAVMRDGDLERTDLAALVQTLVDEQADLGADAKADLPERLIVTCRVAATERCLRNLIENAIKYGGSLRARLFVAGDEAVVQIDDTGPGIPPEALETVFQPFHRLSDDSLGSGLGLAIAQTIAVDQGGKVCLFNRKGGGLRAELRLPLTVL